MSIRLFSAAIIAATAAVSTPAVAMEAMRCNVQTKPGLFQPVLRIVTQGKIQDIRMGQEGLTRTIFYRDRDVLSYVAAKMQVPSTQMPSSISGQCGATKTDVAFRGGEGERESVITAEPEVEREPIVETGSEISRETAYPETDEPDRVVF